MCSFEVGGSVPQGDPSKPHLQRDSRFVSHPQSLLLSQLALLSGKKIQASRLQQPQMKLLWRQRNFCLLDRKC